MRSLRLLLADDDEVLLKGLKRTLTSVGYEVTTCTDGSDVISKVEEDEPDLVILDIMLPGRDGLSVLKEIRDRYPDLPVIMLTARSEYVDRVVGLEMGADDYVSKPFSVRELEARIKAVSRRASRTKKSQIRVGDILVDLSGKRVWKGTREIFLTPREFEILSVLFKNRGVVFSREKLLEICWGYEFLGDSRVVDIQVSRLRDKLEDDPKKPRYILTKRGFGYYCG
ncbi:MAG TPA: response regulator transcription factor [Firmicutes bacterium]|nr:response regulator transcription factor [Candidatus Fermentithermobacillaceae bacterium]